MRSRASPRRRPLGRPPTLARRPARREPARPQRRASAHRAWRDNRGAIARFRRPCRPAGARVRPAGRLQSGLRGLGGACHLDDLLGPRGRLQSLAEQADDLAFGPAAEIVVLVEDDAIEGRAEELALADDVAVAAVAGRRVDARAAAGAGTCRGPRSRRPASALLWP